MATNFSMANKRTYAVYIRSRRDGRDVLLREPYNVIEYMDGDAARQTFIEGVSSPGMDLITGRGTQVMPEEVYEGIRVYDSPPFTPNNRLGSAV